MPTSVPRPAVPGYAASVWFLLSCADASTPRIEAASDAPVAGCPSSPNCVSTASPAEDHEHHAEPWSYAGDIPAAKERMKAIVAAMPRTQLVEETDDGLRFTFRSKLMGFIDDVHVVFREGKVHYRSASRVGQGDLGVNRARVRAIQAEWEK